MFISSVPMTSVTLEALVPRCGPQRYLWRVAPGGSSAADNPLRRLPLSSSWFGIVVPADRSSHGGSDLRKVHRIIR
jgi:hypothetical protein